MVNNNTPTSFRLPLLSSPPCSRHSFRLRAVLSISEIPPNALRRKTDPQWRGGFSLGLDLGLSHTGLALTKGFSFRPLTVLELRGKKLEFRLLEIAENEEANEFIIGLLMERRQLNPIKLVVLLEELESEKLRGVGECICRMNMEQLKTQVKG